MNGEIGLSEQEVVIHTSNLRLLPIDQSVIEPSSLHLPGEESQKVDLPSPIGDTITLDKPIFDPDTHFKWLYERTNELQNNSDINDYLEQFDASNLVQLRIVLSREINNLNNGNLARVLLRHIADKEKSKELEATDVSSVQDLRQGFLAFSKEYFRGVDAVLSPETLLGVPELDKAAILEHVNQLHGALFATHNFNSEKYDFVRSLIDRSMRVLYLRIDQQERKVAQEQATAQLREKRYMELSNILSGIQEKEGREGAQKWFLNLTNNLITSHGREALTMEDIKSLRYFQVISQSASEIVGQEIKRPVFVFQDPVEFTNMFERLVGIRQDDTGAIYLPIKIDEAQDSKTGLMVTKPNEHSISHEINHSIDPYVEERSGADRIVNELFAHSTVAINYCDLADISQDELQRALTDAISHDFYYQHIRKIESQMTYEQFKDLCSASVDVALSLIGQKGNVMALRDIMRAKTLKDLFTLVGRELPILS